MDTDQQKRVAGFIKLIVGSLLGLIIVFGSFGIIDASERGVKVRMGNVVGTVDPGLYFKFPILDKVRKIDIRTLSVTYEREDPLMSASRDLQDVKVATVVNYHIDPLMVREIYTQYGDQHNYEAQIVRPAVRDTVKAVASQFTAEELVTKRAEFTTAVLTKLNDRLSAKFAVVEGVNITNFEFSASFTQAIEAKVTAVQNAEAQKNKLEQVKYEAQQQVEKAKAEAETIRIQAQAVTQQGGKDYVELERVKKWNGVGCTSYCGIESSTGLLISR